MNLFNYEGGLMKTLSKFTDCITLSLLFLAGCIPVFTIGTSAAALYHTARKVLRYDRGYVFRDFTESFRENFRQTAPVWLVVLMIGAILGTDFYVIGFYAKEGNVASALSIALLVGMAVWFAWALYLFPYMSRFENSRKQSMKNAILFVVAHLPMTVLMLALAVAAGFAIYVMPLLAGILPAVYAWIQSYILERIFRRYMSEQDRQKEDGETF